MTRYSLYSDEAEYERLTKLTKDSKIKYEISEAQFIKNMKALDTNISTEDIRKALGNKGRL
jgi:hypothetical protein